MKTNRLLAAVVTLVAASACTPNYQSLLLTGIYPPEPSDEVGACLSSSKPSVAQYAGSLNVGVSNGYYMLVTMDSLLTENDLNKTGNTTVLNELEYRYSTSPGPIGTPVAVPSSETVSISFAVKAKSVDNLILVDMIGPQAKISLQGVPTAPYDEFFTLKSEIRFRGVTLSNIAVQSGTVSFPINIYNQGFSCPAGTQLKPTGPCGNAGQDGSALICCTPDPMTGTCT
jgi:hypothetical protein